MTFIYTLTKDLSITDTNEFNKAVVALMRHMKGLSPLVTCTFCGNEHDGTTALCMSCDELAMESHEEEKQEIDAVDYCY